jgi:hypothetical protein
LWRADDVARAKDKNGAMADRRGLGFIGWMLGVVTAIVIAISGVVVTAGVPDTATGAGAMTLSAASR